MADLFGVTLEVGTITAILVVVVTFLLVYIGTRRRPHEPPGPSLWPIIGNITSFAGKDPLGNLQKLRQKYGDVYGLYIGRDLNIIINGYDTIHDALLKKGSVFSRRPDTGYLKMMVIDPPLVFANGDYWKSHRQFTMNTLRELCFTNRGRRAEELILQELSFFMEKLKSYEQPVDLKMDIILSFANIMTSVLHGKRHDYNDKWFVWYLEFLDEQFKIFARKKIMLDCFSFLSKLPFDVLNLNVRLKNEYLLKKFFNRKIKENVDGYDEGSEDCMVHWYVTAAKSTECFKMDAAWRLLHDLMAAGSETTATTLRWTILHLMLEPEIQAKIHEEIDRIIGSHQPPSLSDRSSMPYTEATVLEGLRIGHVVPLSVPHFVSEEIRFHGYTIPKDSTVMINLHSVLKDPDVFPEPNAFRPERFLDDTGTKVVVPKEFIPFSLGQRSCLGESLARIELFLYITTILQKYEVSVEDPENLPSVDGVAGLTYHPSSYKTRIKPRR